MSTAANHSRARQYALLQGSVLGAILRLAAPNFLLAAAQAAAAFADAYYVGRLGTAPLAGLGLVFPIIALMQMMSAGAIGGGVSSAIARALGAGDVARAHAYALQSIYVALGCGSVFAVSLLMMAPSLYRVLGGIGPALGAALAYSNVIFGGACLVWLANTTASILRGSGNMRMPSAVLGAGALIQMVLGAVLTLGWGPIPRLGIVGAAIAYLAGFGLAALVLGILAVRELRSWSIPLRVPAPQWPLLKEILRVGLLSSLNAAQTVFTALIVTGLVGSYGTAALAGYGVGVRLELLQVPFVFAIGAALVAAAGMNVGAGNMARARRVAWTGGAVGAAITGSVGLIVALRPHWWTGMFSSDPAVLASGYAYLQIAGPCYGFLGFGMAAYFASQGAGRVLGPVLASSARLLIAALGGYLAVHWIGGELTMLYSLIGLSLVVFGLGGALAIARSIFR